MNEEQDYVRDGQAARSFRVSDMPSQVFIEFDTLSKRYRGSYWMTIMSLMKGQDEEWKYRLMWSAIEGLCKELNEVKVDLDEMKEAIFESQKKEEQVKKPEGVDTLGGSII